MTIFYFILGTVVGSFLNVCIYRIPRKESVAWPASHCPCCGYVLKWYDLFPVLSYVLLQGKCRQCRSHISWRYPLVEVITGILFALVYLESGLTYFSVGSFLFICLLLAVALIDLEHFIIPNVIVLPGTVFGLIFSLFPGDPFPVESLLAGLGAGLFFFLIWFLYPSGMGEGDVKLALMMGVFLGWPLVGVAIFLASLIGSVAGLLIILVKKGGRKTPIPFGFFLAIGSILAMFYGDELLVQYLRFIGWQ